MVVPINPIFTGRGKTPLEPQFFYTPAQQILTPGPCNQLDWPLPQGHQAQLQAQRPDYTTTADWTPRFQFPPPDTTKIFRGHLRSLPAQPYPPNFFQSWTQSFFLPDLPLPPGKQITDLAPAQRPPEQVQLHSWTASYNLNLIGKDRLPAGVMPGEAVYDLTPAQRPPEQIQLHSWTWSYNLNLIGKDRMIVGEQVYDLTLSQRLPELPRSWTLDLSTTTLFPVAGGPLGVVANQYSWPLPQPGAVLQQAQPIYNINFYPPSPPPDLTKIFRPHQRSLPDQPAPPLLQQSVFQAYPPLHPTAVGPLGTVLNQYDWPVPKAPQQPAQSYTASYNLNLVGKDVLLAGEQVTDLPPRDFQRLFQTWITNVSEALTVPPPIRQRDWPTPRGAEPDWRRSWERWYNLDLIGQDKFPPGEQTYETPRDYQRLLQTWVQSVNLALYVVAEPNNQYDWPTPRAPQQPALSWTASYNLNLIGQDKLLTGAQVTDLPPRDYQRQLQTWIQGVNVALVTPPSNLPLTAFNQYDWPVPRPYPPAPPSWTASYNQNLIGQDQLPSGKPITDLPPRDISRALQTWITNVSLALTAVPRPLTAFNQYDWPLPQAPLQPLIIQYQNFTINLPPPAPSTQLHQNPIFITMGRLSQLGNLPS